MSDELELDVPVEAVGERLDRFLAARPEIGSRTEAERLVVAGRVSVDGRARPKSHRLEGGEHLVVGLSGDRRVALAPEQMDLRIAYEDEHLLVVDKPAGLVVHPGAGHASGTLVHGLLGRGIAGGDEPERPGIVHRLDQDTSGLLVVARSREAHRRLARLIRTRAVTREYLALVCGRPRSWAGTIEAAIGRDRRDPTRVSQDTTVPREAVTHFSVLELLDRHALLEVTLETGRTHQIRAHLAAIDLPVAGDPVYGLPGELGLERQFLHACRIAFPHPFGGEPIEVVAPLPAELASALELARDHGQA